MPRAYRSLAEARQAFDEYAAIEPRLESLWELCRLAAPPVRATPPVDDVYDCDPFEVDVFAADKPDDGWCAEDFYHQHVKSRLLLLAGVQRPGPSHALQTSEAYDAIYDLLVNWALNRPCACCADHGDDRAHRDAAVAQR